MLSEIKTTTVELSSILLFKLLCNLPFFNNICSYLVYIEYTNLYESPKYSWYFCSWPIHNLVLYSSNKIRIRPKLYSCNKKSVKKKKKVGHVATCNRKRRKSEIKLSALRKYLSICFTLFFELIRFVRNICFRRQQK